MWLCGLLGHEIIDSQQKLRMTATVIGFHHVTKTNAVFLTSVFFIFSISVPWREALRLRPPRDTLVRPHTAAGVARRARG